MDFTALMANPKVKDMLLTAGLSMLANNQPRIGQPPQTFGASLGQGLLGGMDYANQMEEQRKRDYWNSWDRGVQTEQNNTLNSIKTAEALRKINKDELDSNKVDYKTIEENGKKVTYKVDALGNIVERVADSPAFQPSSYMGRVIDPESPTGWTYKNSRGEAIQGAAPPSNNKLAVKTNADGTVEISQGGELPKITTATKTDVEKSLLEAQKTKENLTTQLSGLDRRYLELPYKLKQTGMSWAGGLGIPLPAGMEADRQAYTEWAANTTATFNKYIHDLTGAALSPGEAERYAKVVPTVQDDPAAYIGKANALMKALDKQIQGKSKVLSKGAIPSPTMDWSKASDEDIKAALGL